MNIFNVSFDLLMERVVPPMNYDAFFEVLDQTDHSRLWRTNWLIATSETQEELRDRLMQYLHKNDQIFINPVTEWAAYANTRGLRWLCEQRDSLIAEAKV